MSDLSNPRGVPGTLQTDGATGRRATLAGTGLDVWEIIDLWREVGEDFDALVEAAHWLTEPQLRSALGYYELYPEEIDERLEIEASWTPERLERELPFLRSRRTPD